MTNTMPESRFEKIEKDLHGLNKEELRFVIKAAILANHIEYLPVERAIAMAQTMKRSS